ncbi:ABC transporter substrate-binding protein [Dactylosporangium sp. NPDC005555]|uniref:ABC transporter substrate-binding protein n=1 Tax=Dactylosporangium sp. NPDC005555 TaxID=3154889 RepID=UPI0033BE1694
MSTRRRGIYSRLVAGGALLLMITAAAACGSADTDGSAGGGTLHIAEGAEQPTLDPAKNIQYLSDEMAAIYDTLVVANADGTIGAGLAESWTVEGPSITFKLRTGVKFHDGTPFNAAAVKAALDRVVDPATKATNSKSVLGPYDNSQVIDDSTVKVTWKTPVGAALINLTNADLSIPSPTAASAGTLDAKPVGTGPYKFVSYVKGDRLEVERNNDYTTIRPDLTNKGAPKYARIIFQYVTNASTRANLLTTGAVQVAQLTGPDAKRLASASNLNNASFAGVSETALWINAKSVPDLNVRKAISAAIDRDALIQAVASGYAETNWSTVPTIVPGYDKTVESAVTKYGQAQAKSLLAAAGYTAGADGVMQKDGKPLTLSILSASDDPWPAIDQLVQDQLAQVGIKAQIKTEEFATVTQTRRKGDQSIYIGRYGILDPAGSMRILFACANIPSAQVPQGTNLTFNCNPDVDAALEQAITEVDAAKRNALVSRAQHLMAADHTALVLYQPKSVVFSAKTVGGIGMQPDGILKINDLVPAE